MMLRTPGLGFAPLLAAIFLAALARPVQSAAQCDPFTNETPLPLPALATHHCGNGRIDRYPTACRRVCSGGCGLRTRCHVQCDYQTETCDGADLGRETCRSLEFGGGRLACSSTCDAYDTGACATALPSTRVASASVLRSSAVNGDAAIAARDSEAGLIWLERAGDHDPSVHFATITPDIHFRVRPRAIGDSHMVPAITATNDGYLVALVGETEIQIVSITPDGVANVASHIPSRATMFDFVTADTGEPVLVTWQGPEGLTARVFDSRGVGVPFPNHALHALGRRGRLLMVPLHAGSLGPFSARTTRWAGTPEVVATQNGDELVLFDRVDTLGSVYHGATRAGGFQVSSIDRAPRFELPLPSGGSLLFSRHIDTFEDTFVSTAGATMERWSGPAQIAPPSGVVMFGGHNHPEPVYSRRGENTWGVTVTWPRWPVDGEPTGVASIVVSRAGP